MAPRAAAYRDVGGSTRVGSLVWNDVAMVPSMMVTTLTPKGTSSRRSVSDRVVRAALEEAYVAAMGRVIA